VEKISKGAATRAKILDVALRLIAKHGFWETSVQMIADKVGVSQTAVFVHFKSKDQLFESLRVQVGRHNQMFTDKQVSISDGADKALLRHCMANLQWAQEFPERAQIIVLHYYLGMVHDSHHKVNHEIYENGRERILKYILAGQREKKFHFTQKPDLLAEMIQEFLIGHFVRMASGGVFQERVSQTKLKILLKELLQLDEVVN
jgi:AcrR family transcriptional regulator